MLRLNEAIHRATENIGSDFGGLISWNDAQMAYFFDWNDDWIWWNAVIGRTWYDLTANWNVTKGSDADGEYIRFRWTDQWNPNVGTRAHLNLTSWYPAYNQTNTFFLKARIKINSLPSWYPSWVFGARFASCIHIEPGGVFRYQLRWSATISVDSAAIVTWTLYDLYYVYDASVSKYYCYISSNWWPSTLINPGWTSWPATFSWASIDLWDNAIWASDDMSCDKQIYHAWIATWRVPTQAEIDADIALGNAVRTDPRWIAWYYPENFIFNQQYVTNPKDLTAASWTRWSSTTVTGNYANDENGDLLADRLQRNGTTITTSSIQENITSISWSLLASRTFQIKAQIKATSGTSKFRLRLEHLWVAWYNSSDMTATWVFQEFSLTQILTSSTSGTWLWFGLCIATDLSNADLIVGKVEVYMNGQLLRDNSPNMGWFIGRKNSIAICAAVKLGADGVDTPSSLPILQVPYLYMHIRTSNNHVQIKQDTNMEAKSPAPSWAMVLWNWYRWIKYIVGTKKRTWSQREMKCYIDGEDISTKIRTWRPWNSAWIYNTNYRLSDRSGWRFSWLLYEVRAYEFTSFNAADALAIKNWWEPANATKLLHLWPVPNENWNTAINIANANNNWTLNWWVLRKAIF